MEKHAILLAYILLRNASLSRDSLLPLTHLDSIFQPGKYTRVVCWVSRYLAQLAQRSYRAMLDDIQQADIYRRAGSLAEFLTNMQKLLGINNQFPTFISAPVRRPSDLKFDEQSMMAQWFDTVARTTTTTKTKITVFSGTV